MISSGTNESPTSTDIDSEVRTKRNYTKFSATEAPFCIKLISVAQPQKFGNKRFDEKSRLATCSPPPSTQQLMQSGRHPSRRHQARDACLSIPSMEGRHPQPSHLSLHGSRNTTAAGIRKEISAAKNTNQFYVIALCRILH